jgi:predicted nucleotidyltransferase
MICERRLACGHCGFFGSAARDTATEASDVDVLVEFDRPTGHFGVIAIQDRLESLLGCKVDVGTPSSLKPRIRARVLQECIHVAQIQNDLPPLVEPLQRLLETA